MARRKPIRTGPIFATFTAFALILLVALGGAARSEASVPSDAVKAAGAPLKPPLKGPPIAGVAGSEANASVTQACTRAKKQLKKAKKQLKKAKKSGNKQKIKKAKKKVKRAKKKKKKACSQPSRSNPSRSNPPRSGPPGEPTAGVPW